MKLYDAVVGEWHVDSAGDSRISLGQYDEFFLCLRHVGLDLNYKTVAVHSTI